MSTSPRSTRSAAWSQAVKDNYPQREIAEASFALQQEIDAGERIVVGVNRYVREDEEPIPTLRIDPALERKQLDRLQGVARRARRRERRASARRAARGRRPAAAQPDGRAPAVRPRTGLGGRDRAVAAAGLRRLHRDPRLLAASARARLRRAARAAARGSGPAVGGAPARRPARARARPCRPLRASRSAA